MKYFPNQKDGEIVQYAIRRHWVAYIPHLVFGSMILLALICFIALAAVNSESITIEQLRAGTIVTSLVLLFTLFILLYGFVDHYLDLLIITDERLVDIKQHGFFKQETREIHLLDIENVVAQVEGALAVYLKYGDLVIQIGPDEDERIVIKSIPRASKIARVLMELHTHHISHPNEKPALADQGIEDFGFGGKIDEKYKRDEKDKTSSSYWAYLLKK